MTRYAATLSVLVGAALGLLLTFAPDAHAAPTGTTCTGALCQVDATGDVRVNDSAATDSLEVELCVTTVTRNRTLSASEQLAGAKALYCENRSSATVYVTLDAVTLTTTGSTGYKFAAGTERTWGLDGTNFGPNVGINATATMTTGACLWCSWLK
jgi:hypothetical protein